MALCIGLSGVSLQVCGVSNKDLLVGAGIIYGAVKCAPLYYNFCQDMLEEMIEKEICRVIFAPHHNSITVSVGVCWATITIDYTHSVLIIKRESLMKSSTQRIELTKEFFDEQFSRWVQEKNARMSTL